MGTYIVKSPNDEHVHVVMELTLLQDVSANMTTARVKYSVVTQ